MLRKSPTESGIATDYLIAEEGVETTTLVASASVSAPEVHTEKIMSSSAVQFPSGIRTANLTWGVASDRYKTESGSEMIAYVHPTNAVDEHTLFLMDT